MSWGPHEYQSRLVDAGGGGRGLSGGCRYKREPGDIPEGSHDMQHPGHD